MKRQRPPTSATSRASIKDTGQHHTPSETARLPDRAAPRQDETQRNGADVNTVSASNALAGDGIHLAALWRGARDRTRAIQFTLKQFNGYEFLDIRQYQASSSGFMIPTRQGVTISIAQLGRFAEAAGKAYREAVKRGLVTARSS